jgi:SAM-dependent methyltransferase
LPNRLVAARLYGRLVSGYPSLARFVSMKGWRIRRVGNEIEFSKDGMILVCDYLHGRTMAAEMLAWERLYLPQFSLEGKTVLDVGAGAGETACFYILNGAKKVIAVEPDARAFSYLKANAERNHWNAELHNSCFALDFLGLQHDFMKMDCEGCEELLLGVASIKPCVIEVHSDEIASRLSEKFGIELAATGLSGTSIWVSKRPRA